VLLLSKYISDRYPNNGQPFSNVDQWINQPLQDTDQLWQIPVPQGSAKNTIISFIPSGVESRWIRMTRFKFEKFDIVLRDNYGQLLENRGADWSLSIICCVDDCEQTSLVSSACGENCDCRQHKKVKLSNLSF